MPILRSHSSKYVSELCIIMALQASITYNRKLFSQYQDGYTSLTRGKCNRNAYSEALHKSSIVQEAPFIAQENGVHIK